MEKSTGYKYLYAVAIAVASIGAIILYALYSGSGPNTGTHPNTAEPSDRGNVDIGFFSPEHVDSFYTEVKRSTLNVYPSNDNSELSIDLDRVKRNLNYVAGSTHKINLDLGPVITSPMHPENLSKMYTGKDREATEKAFPPLANHKIKVIVSNEELRSRLSGLPELIKKYRQNVGTIVLLDEPYLNGVPKDEINRATIALRDLFSEHGISDLEFGAIFASALFNRDFALHFNRQMEEYAKGIDNYYKLNQHLLVEVESQEAADFKNWVNIIKHHRLSTYDSSGNIYTQGGIPEELDVVSFDFYLSTLLFDVLHDSSLSYFASIGIDECREFTDTTMTAIKKRLSFIKDGPVQSNEATRMSDKKTLDKAYSCRMNGAATLLSSELSKLETRPDVFMMTESSANGVLEFDSRGRIEEGQPKLLVEQRVYDEVIRSQDFYSKNKNLFTLGIDYFIFQDSYDSSIDLLIHGVDKMPAVREAIYRFSSAPESHTKHSEEHFKAILGKYTLEQQIALAKALRK